jgi:carotenoid cleavage dioxygenase-like enzyme
VTTAIPAVRQGLAAGQSHVPAGEVDAETDLCSPGRDHDVLHTGAAYVGAPGRASSRGVPIAVRAVLADHLHLVLQVCSVHVCRMAKVFEAGAALGPPSRLHRWRITTSGAHLSFRDEVRSDLDADLPSIDRRYAGRPYRHGWRVETRPATDDVVLAGAVHVDAHTGTETRWDPGPQFSSDEWLFVATGPAEAEGVVMTYVYDRAEGTSSLVVLDAQDISAGPIARIGVPQRVPYGFQATWVPTTET